jgi:tetratricopeptide (TPR) repeat protein
MSGRLPRAAAVVLLALAFHACAEKTLPPPVVTTPKYPDFVAPSVDSQDASTSAAINQGRAWQFLQAGDLKTAERELSTSLKALPGFYAAEAALGYVELAKGDPKAALPHFDRAIERRPGYASALVGRGQALVLLHREADALAAFEEGLKADPALTDIARRVEVLRFRSAQQEVDNARDAARAGRLDEAVRLYTSAIKSSPDSPFLYRELAAVERRTNATDAALEHLRKAVELDPSDAASLAQMGDILDEQGDLAGAAAAYTKSVAIEPEPAVQARLNAVRTKLEVARLPEEYRAIPDSPQITRGDLAALIGVRLAGLLQGPPQHDAVLLTDVRGHWASAWILTVAKAGIMEPYANHAFQPRAGVRRSDFAQIAARLLGRISPRNGAGARTWENARLKFADLAAGHLAYPAASIAVASGVMTVGPDNAFQPGRAVTGPEAIEAIDRLAALATSSKGPGR